MACGGAGQRLCICVPAVEYSVNVDARSLLLVVHHNWTHVYSVENADCMVFNDIQHTGEHAIPVL